MAFTFFQQHDSMDCGPACLKMIARHYGKQVNLDAIRQKTQIGKEGVNLLGISEAADDLGFRTRAIKLNAAALTREVELPAILHWNQNHFVVLYKVRRNTCSIADPAKGLIKYTVNELKENWESTVHNGEREGVALLLEPSPAFYSTSAIDNVPEKKSGGLRILSGTYCHIKKCCSSYCWDWALLLYCNSCCLFSPAVLSTPASIRPICISFILY